MNEETKQKFFDYFGIKPPAHTERILQRMAREGTSTAEDDAWGMLNYLLDNLHLEHEELAVGLKNYTHNPTGRKDIYIRIDYAMTRISFNELDMSEEEWIPYAAALEAINTPFRHETGAKYELAKRARMSRDQYVIEAVRFLCAIAETFELLQDVDQNQLKIDELLAAHKSLILKDADQSEDMDMSVSQPSLIFSGVVLDEEELLESMRAHGFLQCDLDR